MDLTPLPLTLRFPFPVLYKSSAMRRRLVPLIATVAIAIVGCGDTGHMTVAGKVTIDKKPVEVGLITFESVSNPGKPTGASVKDGQFAIDKSPGLQPGEYQVNLQAQRRTGKKIRDRQMPNDVEEMVVVNLKNNTLTATVSADNAQNLELNFDEAR